MTFDYNECENEIEIIQKQLTEEYEKLKNIKSEDLSFLSDILDNTFDQLGIKDIIENDSFPKQYQYIAQSLANIESFPNGIHLADILNPHLKYLLKFEQVFEENSQLKKELCDVEVDLTTVDQVISKLESIEKSIDDQILLKRQKNEVVVDDSLKVAKQAEISEVTYLQQKDLLYSRGFNQSLEVANLQKIKEEIFKLFEQQKELNEKYEQVKALPSSIQGIDVEFYRLSQNLEELRKLISEQVSRMDLL
eukprot:TRINITY_DN1611_c0_g1_i1.p1 TRINITY_DN1611_c0_g1~~TRINITY_DN1611_c0_g1_i1.p1  ORF type:complete len:250 (+),score=88.70 TRINITY_DN1611_c0_g1_i1:60-809(+)